MQQKRCYIEQEKTHAIEVHAKGNRQIHVSKDKSKIAHLQQ